MKKFIFTKFAGLQSYSWQLYSHNNSFTDISQQHFIPPPPILPMYRFKPPHVLNTSGKPWDICPLGRWEILLGGEFLCGGGNLRRSDFDHSNLF